MRKSAGKVDSVFVTGCGCVTAVVDGSGSLVGNVVAQNQNGFDYVVNVSDANDRLRTDTFMNPDTDAPALRATSSGNKFASVGVDSANGLMFSDGASFGYSAQVSQSSQESLDIGFASALPPTNVTGTPTTGGTLAAATYFYWVRSATGASNCSTKSAP